MCEIHFCLFPYKMHGCCCCFFTTFFAGFCECWAPTAIQRSSNKLFFFCWCCFFPLQLSNRLQFMSRNVCNTLPNPYLSQNSILRRTNSSWILVSEPLASIFNYIYVCGMKPLCCFNYIQYCLSIIKIVLSHLKRDVFWGGGWSSVTSRIRELSSCSVTLEFVFFQKPIQFSFWYNRTICIRKKDSAGSSGIAMTCPLLEVWMKTVCTVWNMNWWIRNLVT